MSNQMVTATCYDSHGRVISTATNSYVKTHPLQAKLAKKAGYPKRLYLHAEIAALLKARGKEVYKIKVERYTKNGEPANACPCPVCQLAIKQFGVKVIEHTI